MASSKPTVLVLWGDYFDEYAATAFVCELRAAGVRTRLVGIDGRYARGRFGLVLGTDLSLERALTLRRPVAYVILPCQQGQWVHLQRHWQVQQWIERLTTAGATLLVRETLLEELAVSAAPTQAPGQAPSQAPGQATDPPLPLAALRSWPSGAEVVPYARELANLLRRC
jgi:hypothetical protein